MYKEKSLQMSIAEHRAMLISKGYKEIGSGGFSVVYATKSGNHVIKVAPKKQTNGSIDRWFNYAMAVKDKKNPFFPKIKSITMYGNYQNHESYYVAMMERLKPLNYNKKIGAMINIVQYAITYPWRTERGICERILENSWGIDDEKQIYKTIGGKKILPVFMEAIKTIKQVKNRYRADDDIWNGNIMIRGKQVVITDPIC
jgi:hypothetical protein